MVVLAGTKFQLPKYSFVTEAHVCEQLVRDHYMQVKVATC